MQLAEKTVQLLDIMNAEHVSPDFIESEFKGFSKAVKNKAAHKIATTFEPTPSAKLLKRLMFIRTDKNLQDITNAYLLNLNSSNVDVRRACLYGLQELGHPAIKDFALNALKDNDNNVLVAAATILLEQKKQDKAIISLLKQCYQCHKSDEKYYSFARLLEAHKLDYGIEHD